MSDGSEMTKWAVGGMQFKMEHKQEQVSPFPLLSSLHPTFQPLSRNRGKRQCGEYVFSTPAGHMRNQIIKSHNWEESQESKGGARDEGCNEYTRIVLNCKRGLYR